MGRGGGRYHSSLTCLATSLASTLWAARWEDVDGEGTDEDGYEDLDDIEDPCGSDSRGTLVAGLAMSGTAS